MAAHQVNKAARRILAQGSAGKARILAGVALQPIALQVREIATPAAGDADLLADTLRVIDQNGPSTLLRDDAGGNDMELTLTATNGTVSLAGTSGLTITGGTAELWEAGSRMTLSAPSPL